MQKVDPRRPNDLSFTVRADRSPIASAAEQDCFSSASLKLRMPGSYDLSDCDPADRTVRIPNRLQVLLFLDVLSGL
jgi:hypothetical protein